MLCAKIHKETYIEINSSAECQKVNSENNSSNDQMHPWSLPELLSEFTTICPQCSYIIKHNKE